MANKTEFTGTGNLTMMNGSLVAVIADEVSHSFPLHLTSWVSGEISSICLTLCAHVFLIIRFNTRMHTRIVAGYNHGIPSRWLWQHRHS